jgi:hypothetical protein
VWSQYYYMLVKPGKLPTRQEECKHLRVNAWDRNGSTSGPTPWQIWWRWIMSIKWTDKITNKELRRIANRNPD